MNQLPRLEALMVTDSVIDEVIANMSGAFQDDGVDQSTLQQLKQVWHFKVQKSLQEDDPTDDATNVDAKEEPVANKFAAIAVTGAVDLGIKWKLHEIDMSEDESSPLVRRRNMTVGNAMQLDGGLSPIMEESPDKKDAEVNDEVPPEAEASRPFGDDDSSLNSNDELSGEEAAEDDLFDSHNVITCRYNKVSRLRENWKFEFFNGVMTLNGKDYVFKELTGRADF